MAAKAKGIPVIFKKFCTVDQERIEKRIWSDITYVARGRKFVTMETRFSTAKKASEHSVRPIKINEVALLPTYMGWYTPCIKVAEVLPEIDAAWVIAALLSKREDKIHILILRKRKVTPLREKKKKPKRQPHL